MIDDFSTKKLVEYLKPGQKVLIRFGHGLGDTLMFLPLYSKLCAKYSDVNFDLYLESGQELVWGSYDKDTKYDLVFSLNFPMSEGSDLTKAEKCALEEVGLDYKDDDHPHPEIIPAYDKRLFVAVHFQGTSLPGSVNCPEDTARIIWDEIKEAGFFPIECHFEHCFHNPVNKKYDFIDRSVRDIKPTLFNLFNLLDECVAFVGVASGNLMTALTMNMPVCYLRKNHSLENYIKYSNEVEQVNLLEPYQKGQITKWLNQITQ